MQLIHVPCSKVVQTFYTEAIPVVGCLGMTNRIFPILVKFFDNELETMKWQFFH